MAQASAIAMWLMLLLKVAVGVMVFSIAMLCLFWAIRPRQLSKTKDAERGE